MEENQETEKTRGHELYLRHLLLLLEAAPLALKGLIYRKIKDSNGILAELIKEKKDTFKASFGEEFHKLFRDNKVNDTIDSWDVRLLCVVILVLFYSESASQGAKYEALQCILYQVKDLDNYVQNASLDFNTFNTKWKSLHDSIIELIKDIADKAKFECKHMMHSYTQGSIRISSQLIKSLTETNDVYKQVAIALQNKGEKVNITFTERLKDTFGYVDDPVVLTCKLSVSEENVTWRHDYELVENSNTMKKLQDGCCNWLVISRAKLEDGGQYSCVCCNQLTKAYLQVSEKPLKVSKELHVATEKTSVRENMDIVLICKVNQRTSNVIWQHNGEAINSNRHHISLDDNVHKLTILKAQYEDEGDYSVDFGTIVSRTELTLKGNLNPELRKQLTNDLFQNWIRGALGLKYMKLGLEDVSRSIVEKHHADILTRLPFGNQCTQCTKEELLPAHKKQDCPNKSKCICSNHQHKRMHCPIGEFCSKFYDQVLYDHRFFEPVLANTDIQKWANDPWSVAKCYINTPGYHDKSSEKEIDCPGLLSLFINNTFFEQSLNLIGVNGETDDFKKARDTRNDILHNANCELSKGQLNSILDLFIRLFEAKDKNGKAALLCYPGTKDAKDNLNALRNDEINISNAGDFQKQTEELKEHAMSEIEKKAEEGAKLRQQKLQYLEQRLKETEKELQLIRDLRILRTERKRTDSHVVFRLDINLQVIAQNGKTSTQGNERIFQKMKSYHDKQMGADQVTTPTDVSVQRILELIETSENCNIADISNSTTVVVKIYCSTCQAIETSLQLIIGNEFQQQVIKLRKCLEKYEHLKIYDVITSISSESIENARKKLSKRTQIKDITCEKHRLECTWYCTDHTRFFCPTCKDEDHGKCIGLKQVVSDRSYKEQKQSLILKHEKGEYNVKINNLLVNRSDNDHNDCDITSIRMLPNGEILLVDLDNNRLKRMDQTYNIVSYCDLPKHPWDVCCTGNIRAVVSLTEHGIQFVNISGDMMLERKVQLDHKCYALACHGETLYVEDGETLFGYNKDCQQKQVLYKYSDHFNRFTHIAVSDDGERIYIANVDNGLITIDKQGNHLSTLTADVVENPIDVCAVGDGTVLVAHKSGYVDQVDYIGEKVLGTVIGSASGSHKFRSLCFDRLTCRLLVRRIDKNNMTVFKLKMHNTEG